MIALQRRWPSRIHERLSMGKEFVESQIIIASQNQACSEPTLFSGIRG